MPLQFIDIKDSNVKFVNEENDPVKPVEDMQAEILFESMIDKMRIATLEDTQAELLFEIMSIKMGVI